MPPVLVVRALESQSGAEYSSHSADHVVGSSAAHVTGARQLGNWNAAYA